MPSEPISVDLSTGVDATVGESSWDIPATRADCTQAAPTLIPGAAGSSTTGLSSMTLAFASLPDITRLDPSGKISEQDAQGQQSGVDKEDHKERPQGGTIRGIPFQRHHYRMLLEFIYPYALMSACGGWRRGVEGQADGGGETGFALVCKDANIAWHSFFGVLLSKGKQACSMYMHRTDKTAKRYHNAILCASRLSKLSLYTLVLIIYPSLSPHIYPEIKGYRQRIYTYQSGYFRTRAFQS